MKTKIGHVELNGNTELESRFDSSSKNHDWCGPKVKIASVEIYVEFTQSALSLGNNATVHINRHIEYVITDEKGRQITRQEFGVKKLKKAMACEEFGYCLGWADGPTKVVIDEDKMGLINDEINMSFVG